MLHGVVLSANVSSAGTAGAGGRMDDRLTFEFRKRMETATATAVASRALVRLCGRVTLDVARRWKLR